MYFLLRSYSAAFAVFLFMIFMSTDSCVGESDMLAPGLEEPLRCYQCHSLTEPDCTQLRVNATIYYKPCHAPKHRPDDYKPLCRKIVQIIRPYDEAQEVVIRRCGWIRHPSKNCYKTRNIDHKQTVCQCFSSGCNKGATVSVTVALLTFSLALTAVGING